MTQGFNHWRSVAQVVGPTENLMALAPKDFDIAFSASGWLSTVRKSEGIPLYKQISMGGCCLKVACRGIRHRGEQSGLPLFTHGERPLRDRAQELLRLSLKDGALTVRLFLEKLGVCDCASGLLRFHYSVMLIDQKDFIEHACLEIDLCFRD